MNIIRTFLIVLLAVPMGCNINPSKQAESIPQSFNENPDLAKMEIDPTQIKSIDSLLQSFVDEQKLNCVAGFVAQKGNVIYKKAFGMKDIENKVPATSEQRPI